MRNDAYWANRMRILEESLLDESYEYVKNLESQFDTAIREVNKQIATWYQRFAANNEITLAEARRLLTSSELKEFRWTVAEYIAKGQENAVTGEWLKQLENASARVHVSRLDSMKLQLQQQAELLYSSQSSALNASLGNLYTKSYFHTAFELQAGTGVGWSLQSINESAIRKVLSQPWTLDNQTFRDRCWVNKEALVNSVNTQLTQMIMRGSAPDKTIAAIAKEFGVAKNKAGRLVMTESAAFASSARQDCYKDLDIDQYVIVETLDGKTCPLCGDLDGKVYKMTDYSVGVTAPPFHPWCRGTTAPYYEDLADTRIARGTDGKQYEVPSKMNYKEWESYNKALRSEPKITAAMQNINKELTGLETKLKSADSYTRKINDEARELMTTSGLSYEDAVEYAVNHNYDLVRYTNLSKTEDFLSNYNDTVYKLKNADYNIVRVRNTLTDSTKAYKGLNTVVRTPTGYTFELQFHTAETLALKDALHPLYEEFRDLATSVDRAADLKKQMAELTRVFVPPAGSDTIKNFDRLK